MRKEPCLCVVVAALTTVASVACSPRAGAVRSSAPPAPATEVALTSLTGPLPALVDVDAMLGRDRKRPGNPGDEWDVDVHRTLSAAPPVEVRILAEAAQGGAWSDEHRCRVTIRTERGWFVGAPFLCRVTQATHDEDFQLDDLRLQSGSAAGPRVIVAYSLNTQFEEEPGLSGPTSNVNSYLILCGEGTIGTPSCTSPIQIRSECETCTPWRRRWVLDPGDALELTCGAGTREGGRSTTCRDLRAPLVFR